MHRWRGVAGVASPAWLCVIRSDSTNPFAKSVTALLKDVSDLTNETRFLDQPFRVALFRNVLVCKTKIYFVCYAQTSHVAQAQQQDAIQTITEILESVADLPPGNTSVVGNNTVSLFNISLKHILSKFHERIAGIQWRQGLDSHMEALSNNKTVVVVTGSFLLTVTVVPVVHPVFESWNKRPNNDRRGHPIPPAVVELPNYTVLLRLSDIFLKTNPKINDTGYSRITPPPSNKELGEFIMFDGVKLNFQALDGDWVRDWNVGTPRRFEDKGKTWTVVQDHAKVRFIFGLDPNI